MKPVMQKQLHDEKRGIKGDCFRACICSLLEISDNGVPNFIEDPDWPNQLFDFLKNQGFELCGFWRKERPEARWPSDKHYIACGPGPRGIGHAVICFNGKMVHDPHPDNNGLVTEEDYWWLEETAAKVAGCVKSIAERSDDR